MLAELIVVALFQSVGGEGVGHPPAPFRQEYVNQSAYPMGAGPANPHFSNVCRRNVGSRISRQRCPTRAEQEQQQQQPAAAQAQPQTPPAPATPTPTTPEQTSAPPNE